MSVTTLKHFCLHENCRYSYIPTWRLDNSMFISQNISKQFIFALYVCLCRHLGSTPTANPPSWACLQSPVSVQRCADKFNAPLPLCDYLYLWPSFFPEQRVWPFSGTLSHIHPRALTFLSSDLHAEALNVKGAAQTLASISLDGAGGSLVAARTHTQDRRQENREPLHTCSVCTIMFLSSQTHSSHTHKHTHVLMAP